MLKRQDTRNYDVKLILEIFTRLTYMEEIVNAVLKKTSQAKYSENYMDPTIFNEQKIEGIELHVITRYNETVRTIFPIALSITTSENEDIKRLPEGEGYFCTDGAQDSSKVPNKF